MSSPPLSPALSVRPSSDGCTLPIRVLPRAKRNAVGGISGNALKVFVTPPPEDGRANDAVTEVLAAWLGVKRRQVAIISGAASRHKVVRVAGITPDAVQRLVRTLGAGRPV